MLGFPQSTIDKSLFLSNYLQTVSFQVNCEGILPVPDAKKLSKIHTAIEEVVPNFDSSIIPQNNIHMENNTINFGSSWALEYFTPNREYLFHINPNFVNFIIYGQHYKDFKRSEKYLVLIEKLLGILKGDLPIRRVAIRKVNILEVDNAKTCANLEQTFNSELLPKFSTFTQENSQSFITSQIFQKDDFKATVNYGQFENHHPESDKGKVLLDIDLFYLGKPQNSILEIFQSINDEIFNIFCWALKENVIKALSGIKK